MKRLAATTTTNSSLNSSKQKQKQQQAKSNRNSLTARIRSVATTTTTVLEKDQTEKIYYNDDDDYNNNSNDDEEERYSKQYYRMSKQQQHHIKNCYYYKKIKYHWSLLSSTSKITSLLIVIYFFQHVLFGIWDQNFHQIGKINYYYDKRTTTRGGAMYMNNINNNGGIDDTKMKNFAVVINTYKRPDRLREAVQHYANTCGRKVGITQVFVVWCEQDVPIPNPQSFFDDNNNYDNNNNIRSIPNKNNNNNNNNNRAEVHILQKRNSLNSRFEPIELLQSAGVFMVDDDVRVSCPSLIHGFHAWKSYPNSMVGYYPRLASPPLWMKGGGSNRNNDNDNKNNLIYHTWPIVYYRHTFNFVLTKASFLHSKYLELYTNHYPQDIKNHIDQHMNCEDIAMSMLVANYTKYQNDLQQQQQRKMNNQEQRGGSSSSIIKTTTNTVTKATADPPIYVEGSITDRGIFGGISTGTGHMTTRSECLSTLTTIFINNNWESPFDDQFVLSANSWIQHAPGFWWQYHPSNIFEWFAFANTLT